MAGFIQRQQLHRAVAAPRREGYAKLRHRNAIDYPLLSVAVRVDVDAAGVIADLRCVVSALQAKPHKLATAGFVGRRFDSGVVDELCALGHAKCVPVKNIADDPAWRRDMVPVMIRRALADAGLVDGAAVGAA